jgi:2-deoxy-D-gluconate 3-dehydrogenase
MITDLFRLDGQTALVTGCKRGIGRAVAAALAEAGADVVGVSATLEADGGGVGRDVRTTGRGFRGYACDFGDRAALYAFIRQLRADVPRIDILVNNAGTIRRRPAADHPDEDWDAVLQVNLSSQFILTREVGKDMLARGAGKVVFTASLLTFQGGITVPGYAASKGGIGQLTKALANEWAGRGVNVNAVAPGYIETDNTAALRADGERIASILSRIPAGRWGVPADLAGAVVFLCSPAAAYVHGTILPVDGGWLGR